VVLDEGYNGTTYVTLTSEKKVLGLNMTVSFNSSVVNVIGVYANSSGSVFYDIDNANGTLKIVYTNSEGILTTTPKGVIDITLRGVGIGFTNMTIESVRLSDENYKPFDPDVVINGSVTVFVRGDFNHNNEIDIGDICYVADIVVGKIPKDPRADFNNNGRVDIGDLAKIAYYLLGKISKL
jgi:hypothetical protein